MQVACANVLLILSLFFLPKKVSLTASKVSVFGVFLVHIFPHSASIRRDTEYLLKSFCKKLDSYLPNVLSFSLIHLMSMNKSKLMKTADLLDGSLNEHCCHDTFSQGFLAALDVIESKIYKPPPVNHKRKPPSNICKIFFDNKATEFINLPNILHEPVARSSIPSNIKNCDVPTVAYNLENPIYSRIFHFNTFMLNLDFDRFMLDSTILSCNYVGSEFRKHILTSNLKNMRKNKLRKLFIKGPKYRENKTISFEKARLDFIA